jgi:flagellar biosynthetic protein FlhB
MSEDRTQPPSKRRRQLARQQGQVAHSPELTAAAGWLTAVLILCALGDDLASRLTDLVRGPLVRSAVVTADPAAVVAAVRGLAHGLIWPLAAILVGFAAGALVAHQLQVRGLWAPVLVVPDAARLWAFSSGQSAGTRAERVMWSLVKSAVLLAASAWSIRAGWNDVLRLSDLEGPALAHAVGQILQRTVWILAGVLVVLGCADYALRRRRFEAMLRTTPQEQREDRRVMEGDPAARAQRFRFARAWRSHSPELLAGASLVLTAPAGLTLILSGGPPPRRVTVRGAVKGHVGLRARRSAEASNVPQVDAPHLARRLARRPAAGSPIAAELMAELTSIWPAS